MPAKAAAALIEALARSHVDPPQLPDELRYEVDLGDAAAADPAGAVEPAAGPRHPRRARRGDRVRLRRHHRPGAARSRAATTPSAGAGAPAGIRGRTRSACSGSRRSAFTVRGTSMRRRARWRSPSRSFRRRCAALVEEGWHVEAEGRVFRAARAVQHAGQVGHRLVRAARHGRLRRRPVGRACRAARGAAPRRRRRSILDDGTRGWCRRSGCAATPGSRRSAKRRAITSGSGRRRRRCSTRCSRRSRRCGIDEAFARARAELAHVQRHAAARPPPSRSTASCATTSATRSAGSRSCAGSASAAASPTTWGSARPSWCWRCSTARRARPRSDGPRTSLVVVPRSLVFNWMDEAARFAPELRVLDYTGDARAVGARRGLRPRPDDLRHAAARRRCG